MASGTAAAAAAAPLAAYPWARRFDEALLLPAGTPEERLDKASAMYGCVREFVRVCERLAPDIVAGRLAPAAAGGLAGGEKYAAEGIFFKFGRDGGLYGGDVYAAKAAAHELKALRALIAAEEDGAGDGGLHDRVGGGRGDSSGGAAVRLSFPLMAVVDVGGHRIVCAAALPIGRATLVCVHCIGRPCSMRASVCVS